MNVRVCDKGMKGATSLKVCICQTNSEVYPVDRISLGTTLPLFRVLGPLWQRGKENNFQIERQLISMKNAYLKDLQM